MDLLPRTLRPPAVVSSFDAAQDAQVALLYLTWLVARRGILLEFDRRGEGLLPYIFPAWGPSLGIWLPRNPDY